jgi:hypothetical protein
LSETSLIAALLSAGKSAIPALSPLSLAVALFIIGGLPRLTRESGICRGFHRFEIAAPLDRALGICRA